MPHIHGQYAHLHPDGTESGAHAGSWPTTLCAAHDPSLGAVGLTEREYAISHEADQMEAAARALGCPAGGRTLCSERAALATIRVSDTDLQEAAAALLRAQR